MCVLPEATRGHTHHPLCGATGVPVNSISEQNWFLLLALQNWRLGKTYMYMYIRFCGGDLYI